MQWGNNKSLSTFFDKISGIDSKLNVSNNLATSMESQLNLANSKDKGVVLKATPKEMSVVEASPNLYGAVVQPRSIGFDDGLVYGTVNTGNKIFRCSNGFETMTTTDLEYGQSFDDLEGFTSAINGVFKTHAGYVVLETKYNTWTKVWFSTSFTEGFEIVAHLDRGGANAFNMCFHNGSPLIGDSVALLGEYMAGRPNPGLRLFASFDGGATWEVIKTLPTTDLSEGTQSIHWHAVAYDKYDGRIWAVNGDGANANLHYSYDKGKTWDIVPLSSYTDTGLPSHHPQPTLLFPTEHKLVCGPDNGLRSGLVSLIKDTKYTDRVETFDWKLEYAVHPKTGAASGPYPVPFYAEYENEAYIICPSSDDIRYVLGTGDGGNSWYKVAVFRGTAPNGIVGVDKNGYMYVFASSGSLILKIKKTEWIYS